MTSESLVESFERRQRDAEKSKSTVPIAVSEFEILLQSNIATLNRIFINGKSFNGWDMPYRRYADSDLDICTFTDCNLQGAIFNHASLQSARFVNCDLNNASFYDANLQGAEFINCGLTSVNFAGANIRRTCGLMTVAPVGTNGRLVYAYVHDQKIRIQAGCRNADPKKMRLAISADYAYDPAGCEEYTDVVRLLERWGKREIKRLKRN